MQLVFHSKELNMKSTRNSYAKRIWLSIATIGFCGSPVLLAACGRQDLEQQEQAAAPQAETTRNIYAGRKYELVTPTGERIMAAALSWQTLQEQSANAASYAQPAQCARNISKVMAMAGLNHLQSAAVPGLVDLVRQSGGFVWRLPKDADAIAQVVASRFRGKIPTGTIVAGCLYENCGGHASDGHVAIVGDIDTQGALKVYHNNWYRPDNEGGQWKEHMIPLAWYNQGYKRKFMATPWMNIFRQPVRTGVPYAINIELPAIDDLDPTNYFVTLAVPKEIWHEFLAGNAKALDSAGNQVPYRP